MRISLSWLATAALCAWGQTACTEENGDARDAAAAADGAGGAGAAGGEGGAGGQGGAGGAGGAGAAGGEGGAGGAGGGAGGAGGAGGEGGVGGEGEGGAGGAGGEGGEGGAGGEGGVADAGAGGEGGVADAGAGGQGGEGGEGGAGGEGGGASAGACDNEDDTAALEASEATLSDSITSCVFMCFGQDEACNSNCIQGETGVSDGCAACFGTLLSCTVSNCALQCIDANGQACADCRAQNCDPAFTECAGIAPR
jgi:hypothetical protein